MNVILEQQEGKYLPVNKQPYLTPVIDFLRNEDHTLCLDLRDDLLTVEELILRYNILSGASKMVNEDSLSIRMCDIEESIEETVKDMLSNIPEDYLIKYNLI